MARILVGEPSPEIRLLLDRVVARLGHEVVHHDRRERARPPDADVLLLEPELTGGLELALALRGRRPDVEIVVVSIYAPSPEVAALRPAAHLVKPFTRSALEHALREAVARAATSPVGVAG